MRHSQLRLVATLFVATWLASSARAQSPGESLSDAGANHDGGSHADAGETEAGAGLAPGEGDAGAATGVAPAPADEAASRNEPGFYSGPAASLPPALPEPEIAPIVVGRDAVPEPSPIAKADRPAVVIKTLLGLLALLALAWLGGHPRVQEMERRLGVSQLITAGFPFVLLGMFARMPKVALLSDDVLANVSPLLRIGLGCIGFAAGFRFSAQIRVMPGPELVRVATFATTVPFLVVGAVSGLLLLMFSGPVNSTSLLNPVFIRDAVILATAGAMSAKNSAEIFRADDTDRVLARVLRLEELAGIIGLAVVAAYFRSSADVTWHLPGTAWLLVTIGLGTTLGLIAYFVFSLPQEGPEFVVLTLGAIGFCAGMAGYLRLSPVVVAFIAGTLIATLPESPRDRIRVALRRLERPVYFLSLIVIGALWQVDDWRGWVLIPVFTLARFLGKWLGARGGMWHSGLALAPEERQVLALSPMGPLAIAIVVNAQLLYPGGSISKIVAAVIGGAILTEVVVQLASRRGGSSPRSGSFEARVPEPTHPGEAA